jgi:hypothetical protein
MDLHETYEVLKSQIRPEPLSHSSEPVCKGMEYFLGGQCVPGQFESEGTGADLFRKPERRVNP